MRANRNLHYVEVELYRNGKTYYSLVGFYCGYGFRLKIINLETDETVFEKFLKTQDTDYVCNYLRKVARNNFGAVVA